MGSFKSVSKNSQKMYDPRVQKKRQRMTKWENVNEYISEKDEHIKRRSWRIDIACENGYSMPTVAAKALRSKRRLYPAHVPGDKVVLPTWTAACLRAFPPHSLHDGIPARSHLVTTEGRKSTKHGKRFKKDFSKSGCVPLSGDGQKEGVHVETVKRRRSASLLSKRVYSYKLENFSRRFCRKTAKTATQMPKKCSRW